MKGKKAVSNVNINVRRSAVLQCAEEVICLLAVILHVPVYRRLNVNDCCCCC